MPVTLLYLWFFHFERKSLPKANKTKIDADTIYYSEWILSNLCPPQTNLAIGLLIAMIVSMAKFNKFYSI